MNKSGSIKVGFCVSYDWELLRQSIPRIYTQAETICLALDKERKTWSGNAFAFNNNAFYDFVKKVDTEKKIEIYEDRFSKPELNARQNCNRHRSMIAEKMGTGGWHIQVDCDEYFLDFDGFVAELKRLNSNPTGKEKPINITACLIPLIKKTNDGYLFVDFHKKVPETAPFATNKPDYQRARNNGHFNFLLPFYVIHETWSRSSESLWFKINNWGHSSEELEEMEKRKSYFELWKSLDKNNYHYVKNIHPAKPEAWPALQFCSGKTIEEFIQNFKQPDFPLSSVQLALRNNRNVARLRSILSKP